MSEPLVRKRCFVQMHGYLPIGADHCHGRFIREMARFQKTWNVQGEVSPVILSSDGCTANWTVGTWGPNWRVETAFHYFRWDDLVTADMSISDWRRIPLGIASLLEFVLNGTVIKYFSVAWRYGCFSLYPLVATAAMIWLSVWAARFAASYGSLPYPLLLASILAAAFFTALWLMFGRLLYIRFAFDDWCFARDFVHRARPQLERRLDRLARELVRLTRETDADEIVVAAHSFGVPLALVIIDRALQIEPRLGGSKSIRLISSGSSLLQVALHPAADWLRETVRRVANAPAIYWVEFQALADVMSAYKADPLAALGLPAAGKPIIMLIRIRLMLDEATYRRFRLNFVRVHSQTVMGNERRYFCDYYMLCCGPIGLSDRVRNAVQAVTAFAADGALIAWADETKPLPSIATELTH